MDLLPTFSPHYKGVTLQKAELSATPGNVKKHAARMAMWILLK